MGLLVLAAAIVASPYKVTFASAGLADTSSGVHQALIFNYMTSPCGSGETGIDYVWGASCPPTTGTVHDYYIPWSSTVHTSLGGSYYDINWVKANHPDWLLYKSDETTPAAYIFSSTNPPPIDYTNPAVQQWVIQTDILPALAAGYNGIAFDNNPSLNAFAAAGHFTAGSAWVQQYSGAISDSAWANAQTTALAQIAALVHQTYPNALITINNGYFPYWYNMSGTIWDGPSNATGIAGVLDEGAFGSGSGQRETGSGWLDKMTKLADYAQTHALTLISEQGYTVTSYLTDTNSQARNDLQWDLANYLLAKGAHSYFFWGGNSQYGYGAIPQHEFATVQAIGSPTNTFYASQGVYMRNFTGGLVLMNSNASNSYTVSLPVGQHQDLYGNSVTSYTMSPASGRVLLSTVNSATLTATTTTLTSSANPSVFGQSVTLTATVKPVSGSLTPTGTVTFNDGSIALGSVALDTTGQAALTTSALGVGTRSITATYSGDSNYAGSTSAPVSVTVTPASTTTTLSSSANPSVAGQSVTFTATVSSSSGTPTGTVTFGDGGSTLGTGALNASGMATFSTSALSVRTHSITATYGGDTKFATSTSSTLVQSVGQASTTSLTTSSTSVRSGHSVTFTATVSSSSGSPTGLVTFKDGTTVLGSVALNSERQAATMTTSSLSVGTHSITATYGGDSTHLSSTSTAVAVTVTPVHGK